ncbi:MAG: type I polyketide synthase, partial [Chloroflexi bacterium]|nr:type I polyketide synthase [Chloroflexota bacterium]
MNNTSEQLDRRALLQNALVALEEMQAKLDASEQARREPIAIIGLSCRFPRGANSPEEFWQLLRDNVDAVTEVPPERWNADEYYDANPDAMGKMYTRHGAFLDAFPDKFDAAFFGISPREAITMDPQHRLLLEVSWEALENAGMSPNSLAGSQTGVFVGMCTNDYSQMQARLGGVEIMDTYSGSGAAHSIAAGRISYTLGLHGPCVTVDTACSSSLVSIHLAVQSLRLGESALALAGGVNLTLGPDGAIATSRGRMLSADGHCKTFDALANGYVRGEGCGVVVLKRLSDALAAGDTILALVRGSAINQDGRSNGLTAPHGPSQEAVIRAALADAKLEPGDVNYIEAHGTGTSLGDPIEVNAIGAVMADSHSFENPLMIGAVKSNIGHLEGAAGVAGLIKIVLAMQNGVIPSNLHFHNPNPLIPWDELPVKIPTQNLSWPAGDKKRVAGVSSFGFSGTNAHLIIEEAPMREKPPAPPVERPLHLLALSAKGEAATRDLARQFVETPNISLADLCYTANTGRSHFSSRVALTANTTEQLREKLAAVADGKMPVNTTVAKGQPRVAFLFTGQGSQYAGMARQLYETQPSFRKTLDKCDELLRPYLNPSLLSLLFSPTGSPSLLDQTAYTQPALFAVEYALAELWRSWGVEPTVVLGHSVGEYVAACVAGVFSLEDGLRLIAERGRLMGALPAGGEMVAVFADEARVTKAIATAPAPEAVSIAAINGLANVVISGAGQAIQTIVEKLKAEGVKSKRLVVSHAFHSPLMEPILDEFEQVAAGVSFATPQIGVMSNVTGQMATADDLTNADYWRRHVRGAVRFADSILALQQQGYDLFIEIGPKPTLMSMGQQCWPGGGQPATWLPSLREGRDDWQSLLDSLGALYMQGLNVDWAGFDADYAPARSKVTLPTYPFQRARYWFTLPESRRDDRARDRKVLHPLLHGRLRSPALKETVFESEFSADWPSFLKDHQIYETVIFPGTGYLEMALAAASQLGPGPLVLESVSILNPFMLPEGETRVAQVVLSPVEDGRASFKILSLEVEDSTDSWKLHATGEIRVGEAQTALKKIDLAEVGGEAVDAGDYYRSLSELGVEYGPTFQGVKKLWRGEAAAWGEIRLAPEAGEASS